MILTSLLVSTGRRVGLAILVAVVSTITVGVPLTHAQSHFVIEGEDFNYNGGLTLPAASVMPYLGGAYAGLSAVSGVDFVRNSGDNPSDEYRSGEDPNVPMNWGPDQQRAEWTVTTNYKLGWIGDGSWMNYTRTFPAGTYRVFAAISFGDTQPSQCRGSLQLVTGNPSQANQTVQELGTFDGPGTGGWGSNALVPLKDAGGKAVLVTLSGAQTIRFSTSSGDFDYLDFVRAGPPQIGNQPSPVAVMENRTATFTVTLASEDPANFQWQSNQVDIVGATNNFYTFQPALTANGSRYRCKLQNPLGSAISAEVLLTVTPDTAPPVFLKVINTTPTTLRLTFDESVAVPAGDPVSLVQITPALRVLGIARGTTANELDVSVDKVVFGTRYTVSVQGVLDLARNPNPIANGAQASFIASEYSPLDLGSTNQTGTLARLPDGGFDITASGAGIVDGSDQLQFAWEERTGDFDIQTRVASLSVSDPFARAGLMLRETLQPTSRFAAIFASTTQQGDFFQYRATAGTPSASVSVPGGFPANYPQNWLRLRRTGTTLTGFASFDGKSWVQLGSVSLAGLPSKVYVGLAVSSDTTNRNTAAQFRQVGTTASTTANTTYAASGEPLAPCNRSTGIVISEILYDPGILETNGNNLQFIEIYNARAIFEDLSGWRLGGDIDFTFPQGFRLEAGQFAVLAAAPSAVQTAYAIQGVLGPWKGSLPRGKGTLRLYNEVGALRLDLSYDTQPPWPVEANAAGHSLVLARPSYGEHDPRAWGASQLRGGSPGQPDPIVPSPLKKVVLNEILAHTDDPQVDFIELYNASTVEVDLSGCILTDDVRTNKFRITDGTKIPAGGFIAFDQNQLGFSLSSAGETIYFIDPAATRILDALRFGAQENGVSLGRSPDGSPTWRRLASPTQGTANAPWRVEEIVINEIMYNPMSGDSDDEYVELYNRGTNTLDLSRWRFTQGIDFTFPPGTTLAPDSYLVVARNLSRLLTNYTQLNDTNAIGDFSGSLANGGERLVLSMPHPNLTTNDLGVVETNWIYFDICETRWYPGGRWGTYADGGGSSLELIDPHSDPLRASNWADSDESKKAQWTTVSVTGKLDNGNQDYPPDRLHIGMQGLGECMVDDVEVLTAGGASVLSNGGFESGTMPNATGWSFFGNHVSSAVEAGNGAGGGRGLHVRSQGDGDTGINSIRAVLNAGLTPNAQGTIRAKVRWVAGWPEVLFRLRGAWLELPARMAVPKNLGSPGLANSRRVVNAGPAIYDVTHYPPLPAANQIVVVTARASDPDGIGSFRVRFRKDPATSLTIVTMHDDGQRGDAVAGDGIFSAQIPGQTAGSLIAFRVEASDAAATPASTTFPAKVPAQECLIRWGEPIPFGTFTHYHVWNTQATEDARNTSVALNNLMRDCTLVYGNSRVLYNVGFRDKGSPYHGGAGDLALTVPYDDSLLGIDDRVFASTGNGGSEQSGLRGQVSAWIAQKLGIPYLHSHYILVYRNGGQMREIMEDLEQPSRAYAQNWFPNTGDGDLFKVAIWFEFQDDNASFGSVGATLEPWLSGSDYKLARYRWNFQRRPNDGTANNLTNIFNLVAVVNDVTTNFVPRLSNLAAMDEWMRVFAFHRVLGNWDSWGYSVGQNMYIWKPPTDGWLMMPWDIDFVLGLGEGAGGGLWGGQDPILNRIFDEPAFRRMLWRAYQEAVGTPMDPAAFGPQIDARREVLVKNGIQGLTSPADIWPYMQQRRAVIQNALAANDAQSLELTTGGGADFTSTTPSTVLTGRAPFAVASIEVNGIVYPVVWTDQNTFQVAVPLQQKTNTVVITALDRNGQPLAGLSDTITIRYNGIIQAPENYIVISELHYNPLEPSCSFIELYNRSSTTTFDLSGWRIEGVGLTLAEGTLLNPNAYMVFAKNRAALNAAYGVGILVAAEFPGSLENNGEYVALVRPGVSGSPDTVITDVRYRDRAPWPETADGQGPSLQLVDSSRGSWRPANWSVAPTNSTSRVTPGRANSVQQALAGFPDLWINEVLPSNTSGIADNTGAHSPWIEIYNAGASSLDISALYLTDTYTNLNKWHFPEGSIIGPKGFLIVYADGHPERTAAGFPHTNFQLDATTGIVALVRAQGSPTTFAVMDYLEYNYLLPDRSYGCYPDGNARKRLRFAYATPGSANNPAVPPMNVTINEFMAGNTATITNTVGGQYDDWFELYNGGGDTVDLTGFFLTDDLTNKTKFAIPAGLVIPPGGFQLVWADEKSTKYEPGADLHANFKLSLSGEQLGLFAPDGALVDAFSFGKQTNDVSTGRFPDGGEPPLIFMPTPSPRGPNVVAGANLPPTLQHIGAKTATEGTTLRFTAVASDPDQGQQLTYSLSADAPLGAAVDPVTGEFTWTPTEGQGPNAYSLAIRAFDNGTPSRGASERITITVLEANQQPALDPVQPQQIAEGSRLTVRLTATDPDLPPNKLTFSLASDTPFGAQVDPVTGVFTWIPVESQGPGEYTITAIVTDDGIPPLSGEVAFHVTVLEANNPPVFSNIPPQSLDEGTTFTLTAVATDLDSPPSPVRYGLDVAPVGALIDPVSGLITWPTSEKDGPTNVVFVVRATETTPPNLTATATFGVTVREVNSPPILRPIADTTVEEGGTVAIQAIATDPDLPRQAITYALASDPPTAATIDPATGWIIWAPGFDAGKSTNTFTVTATDNGNPSLSDARTFSVVVRLRPHVIINEIMYRPTKPGGQFVELFNNSTDSVDIGGGHLVARGFEYTFPGNTIVRPGRFLVLAENLTGYASNYPGAPAPFAQLPGSINGNGDRIQLLISTSAGEQPRVASDVAFETDTPWPAAAATGGGSLQLIDARQDTRRVANWRAIAAGASATPRTLLDFTDSWRYNQLGQALGKPWISSSYDDASWPVGYGLLHVENADLPEPKGTILALGPMVFYFRTHFTFNDLPAGANLKLQTVIDDGVVFYLNGTELYRLGMPDANQVPEVAYTTLPSRSVGDAVLEGPFDVPASALRTGDNVLAAEVHQISAGSSDIVLGAHLEVTVPLAPFTPGATNSVAMTIPPFPKVWINEIQPWNTATIADGTGAFGAWAELLNPDSLPVDLGSLALADQWTNLSQAVFPTNTWLGPESFNIIWCDGRANQTTSVERHTPFALNPAGGTLILVDHSTGQPRILDYLRYPQATKDTAIGAMPDGSPNDRTILAPTPGLPNVPPVQPLELVSAGIANDGGFVLGWTSQPGATYVVQAKHSLEDVSWIDVASVTASTTETTVTVEGPGAHDRRFFRVLQTR